MPVRRVAMISYHTCPLASQEGKETGGMNVYVLELAKELSRKGIAVDVFTRSQDEHIPHLVPVDPLFRVIHIPAGPESPVPKKQLIQYLPEFVANILKFIAREGVEYDVMHSHYYLSGLAGLDILPHLPREIPMLMTFHTLALMKNLVARDEREWEEEQRIDAEFRLVQAASRIIAPSDSDKSYLQYLYQADISKVEVIPPGVDLDHFRPLDRLEARAQLGMDPDEHIILFCGRIEPLKGIDMLMYAMRIMVEQQPELKVCLWIIGGDISQHRNQWSKELQKLEQLRRLLHLTPVVHFAGQQSQDVLPLYYNAADVLVMPSHYESFGMAAAEAMACGVPVITTNVTGISSLIDDAHELLITSVNNPLLLASQMADLLTDAPAREQISRTVYQKVQDLAWRNIADRIVTLYQAAIDDVVHKQHGKPKAVVHL
ncbi:MAG: glycosyltransferase [Chloroflexi bacterium]|nr:glycosyltransferase [Chloroflexota bacterium]